MGGGFFVAADSGLYRRVLATLLGLGGVEFVDAIGGSIVQISDHQGRLLTVYEKIPGGTDWELREGEFSAAQGVALPNLVGVQACPFECRWSDMLAECSRRVADSAKVPTWVLDGDGVLWNADSVDVLNVRL